MKRKTNILLYQATKKREKMLILLKSVQQIKHERKSENDTISTMNCTFVSKKYMNMNY